MTTATHFEARALQREFPLSREERDALIKALHVLEDNWWLTDVESRVLARLIADERRERRRALLVRCAS